MKKSISVPMVTCFAKTRFFHQARKYFAWASLLAAFHLFACPLGWASGGWMTGGGVTGGDGLPTEADCRSCHEDLLKFPMLEEANVNKHHRLVGSQIILTTAPPEVELGEIYECLSCHPAVWDAQLPGYTVALYRDCLVCHPIETVSGPPRMQGSNRHHKLGYSCSVCHEQRR